MSNTLEEQPSSHSRKRMTDCMTRERQDTREEKQEDGREKREREGRKEEERGRMTSNNFSLEERPHIEKLLFNNTGRIRESMCTHKYYPVFFPLYSTLCSMRKIETICLQANWLFGLVLPHVQLHPEGCMFLLCVTGINETSERNATTEETNTLKMATESPEERHFKCAFSSLYSY